MATTAIGTLIPILSDAGEMRTTLRDLPARCRRHRRVRPDPAGHPDPVQRHPLHEALILLLFVVVAVLTGRAAVRSAWKGWPLVERTFETSSQLAVRLAVVLVFSLVALASQLGLDLLLGGFVAGMITRWRSAGREVAVFESKLTAVGYGLLIPFFFVTSGMALQPRFADLESSGMLKLPMFVVLFLVVRGVPALLLYRRRWARATASHSPSISTELPLVVAITTSPSAPGT